jgi:hypothetical protein
MSPDSMHSVWLEQMKKLTNKENEEDLTVDDLFNAAVVMGNLPHKKNNMPTWLGDIKTYAMLECNNQQNQQAFEQTVKNGFLFGLMHVNVQTDTHMIVLQKIGDFMFFLPGEFDSTFLIASPQNAAKLLFTKVGHKILSPIFGAPFRTKME